MYQKLIYFKVIGLLQTQLFNYSVTIKPLKILITTTSAVNFINVLRTAFTSVDPECAKRQSCQQCHLALLGPTIVKAAHKTLVKFTPERDIF